jgi:hypothetical protein
VNTTSGFQASISSRIGLSSSLHAERADLVPGAAQRRHDVVFGFPFIDFLLGVPLA